MNNINLQRERIYAMIWKGRNVVHSASYRFKVTLHYFSGKLSAETKMPIFSSKKVLASALVTVSSMTLLSVVAPAMAIEKPVPANVKYDWSYKPKPFEVNCTDRKVVSSRNIKISAACAGGYLVRVTVEITDHQIRKPDFLWQSGSKEIPIFTENINFPNQGGKFFFRGPSPLNTKSGNVRVNFKFDGRG
jgi:hypothetical protein